MQGYLRTTYSALQLANENWSNRIAREGEATFLRILKLESVFVGGCFVG